MVIKLLLTIIFVLLGCAPAIDTDSEWVRGIAHLPKLEGYSNAGFYELDDSIYSRHCDNVGNMIRMKYDEEGQLWKRTKYETHGCI